MDRFANMQTFVRVVESGSISTAARRLNIAKSAVSRRIAELEERLGAQLFRRTTRTLNLTETGRSFHERCVRILSDVEEAELAVSREHGTLRGTLRVAAPVSFGLLHLAPAISDFARVHPQVEFDLDFDDRQVDLLQEGFDAAIRIARLSDSSLIARRLATVHNVVCASPAYLARCGEPRRPGELTQHACLVYANAPEPKVWRHRGPDGKEGSVRVHPHLQANNGDFLREAAIAGQGIIMGPTFIVYRAVEQGLLVPVLTRWRWPSVNAYAAYPQTRHLSQRVRVFVDFLAERFAGVPYWDTAMGR
ncbi:MAG: LysR family transcriptional regulator [Gammaproteobacteria bacterium]|nr:LysR family transcriptional regulator [Gammaproteobacteria bacterium]NIR97703.1 LysR family transcriptional regulator [Gammaproteobacteria bacterium]NIT62896.1 LysR family transcriptional regulator [Gammaproteobacteria bacterium]NIV19861.1 LysR family transcriptional regulator [Gammaproteobacteria bacterium]NIX11374.1 LysR family transcriptional regulator [Gammaproteobacteria bacterium]